MFSLHIDTGREMRGGQWQVFYLLRGLEQAGHRIRLLAPAGSPLLEAALAQRLDAHPLRVAALRSAAGGADLVHAHTARAHTMAISAGKPFVVSRRVAFPVHRGAISRWKYRRAAHYIAVSDFVKNMLLDAGIDASKISVVYDGVPLNPEPAARNCSRVLALDSDDPAKGRRIVEEAAALADIPVHFSKNLSRDLSEAALFVYITDLEGLGSAALLAMAAGVPVVASRTGGLPEIVEDGVTGLLTSNEPALVAQAIRRALSDREFAARLGACGRARVEKEFSVDRMVMGTLHVYERILA